MELGSHGAGVVWCERPAWASVGWRDQIQRIGTQQSTNAGDCGANGASSVFVECGRRRADLSNSDRLQEFIYVPS